MTPELLTGIYVAGAMATGIVMSGAIDQYNRTVRFARRIQSGEHIAATVFSALFWPFVAFMFVVIMGEGDD